MKYSLPFTILANQVYKPDVRGLPQPAATMDRLDMIVGIVFGVLGTIAVLMIVIGGFRYIISKGEPREMAQAKNTIIYALVGLAVCIMAWAIVSFVIRVI